MDPLKLHHPSRRLGQNFLTNQDTASQIVSLAELSRIDTVIEPGAGFGTLTELLEKVAGRVFAVEKDRRLVALLRARFTTSPIVQIIEGDVLKVPLPNYNRLVGTPPYNISSKLILHLLASNFEAAHIVLQKEFGQRLLAKPGTEDYGRLSVVAQRKLRIISLLQVPRTAFDPRPKVDSMLLRLEPRPSTTTADEAVFNDLIRGIFVQRRRLVRGAMGHYLDQKLGRESARILLKRLTLPDARVYQLSIAQFEDLAFQLSTLLQPPEP